ncbi:MAG: hypothetical protein C0485_05510 [Pirellula sp.]|nr:hypothetical protein [Pirellula sp.]
MIAMTAFAVVAAMSTFIGFAPIVTLAAGFLLLFVLPVSLGTLAFYSRGPRRTFFIGAFAGSLSAHYMHRDLSWGGSIVHAAILLLLLTVAIISCGFTALYTRRFLERSGWHLPPADDAG